MYIPLIIALFCNLMHGVFNLRNREGCFIIQMIDHTASTLTLTSDTMIIVCSYFTKILKYRQEYRTHYAEIEAQILYEQLPVG